MLTPREIAAQLSPREFITLSSALDEKYGKITNVSASNTGLGTGGSGYSFAERRNCIKFSVLEVKRGAALTVLVELEDNRQITVAVVLKEKAA